MIVDQLTIPKGASKTGSLEPDQRIEFTVVLAAKQELPPIHTAQIAGAPHLKQADLRRLYGAKPGAAALVETFAR